MVKVGLGIVVQVGSIVALGGEVVLGAWVGLAVKVGLGLGVTLSEGTGVVGKAVAGVTSCVRAIAVMVLTSSASVCSAAVWDGV